MSSATLDQLTIPAVEPVQHFVFRDVDWPTYRTISDALPERHLRAAYDGSNFEIMSTSSLHGRLSRLLAKLLFMLSEEIETPICSCGDFTLNRDDLERSLQPDECFYVQHEADVRGKKFIDMAVDPPPDLAIEIDVSRSSVDRLAIYARLGVPEVWRLSKSTITCYHRQPDSTYRVAAVSQAFPYFSPGDLVPFVARSFETDDLTMSLEFRSWIRERIASNWDRPAN